jgi:ribose 5-phosphate isomerase B
MKVAIGADHGGLNLKAEINDLLQDLGIDYTDFGTHSSDSID